MKIALLAFIVLTGCSDLTGRRDALKQEVADLETKVKSERAKLDVLIEANRLRRLDLDKPVQASSQSWTEIEKPKPAAMCYKDYCPCEGEQEGMDSILCDQLEAGVDVDVRMMIAGRGGREVRRQLETGDY